MECLEILNTYAIGGGFPHCSNIERKGHMPCVFIPDSTELMVPYPVFIHFALRRIARMKAQRFLFHRDDRDIFRKECIEAEPKSARLQGMHSKEVCSLLQGMNTGIGASSSRK